MRADGGERVDVDGEHHAEGDHRDLRGLADAEPQDEQRLEADDGHEPEHLDVAVDEVLPEPRLRPGGERQERPDRHADGQAPEDALQRRPQGDSKVPLASRCAPVEITAVGAARSWGWIQPSSEAISHTAKQHRDADAAAADRRPVEPAPGPAPGLPSGREPDQAGAAGRRARRARVPPRRAAGATPPRARPRRSSRGLRGGDEGVVAGVEFLGHADTGGDRPAARYRSRQVLLGGEDRARAAQKNVVGPTSLATSSARAGLTARTGPRRPPGWPPAGGRPGTVRLDQAGDVVGDRGRDSAGSPGQTTWRPRSPTSPSPRRAVAITCAVGFGWRYTLSSGSTSIPGVRRPTLECGGDLRRRQVDRRDVGEDSPADSSPSSSDRLAGRAHLVRDPLPLEAGPRLDGVLPGGRDQGVAAPAARPPGHRGDGLAGRLGEDQRGARMNPTSSAPPRRPAASGARQRTRSTGPGRGGSGPRPEGQHASRGS